MEWTDDLERRVSGIAVLDQPIRRDLYRLLAAGDGWTSRDEAAEALAVPRSVAAFHLDKLVEAGVAEVRFERMQGRTGPGAGRPAKLYRRSRAEVAASVPPRHYDLAGELLAAAIEESTRTGTPIGESLSTTARAQGRSIGEAARAEAGPLAKGAPWRRAFVDLLARCGYEPNVAGSTGIDLVNCPFHRLADAHRELVCGMNLDFLSGMLEGMGGADRLSAKLEPQPGHCCVRFGARNDD
jgi:predicted ArsR family transcriptional regulator